MTWSVATPTWVAPCSSITSIEPSTPRTAATSIPSWSSVRRHREVVAEQLVGPVDQVDLHRPRTLRAGNLHASALIARPDVLASTVTRVNDEGFLAELAPAAEQLLDRHLGTAKEWFPHEMVPWSRGRDFAEDEAFDPERGAARRRRCAARCS